MAKAKITTKQAGDAPTIVLTGTKQKEKKPSKNTGNKMARDVRDFPFNLSAHYPEPLPGKKQGHHSESSPRT